MRVCVCALVANEFRLCFYFIHVYSVLFSLRNRTHLMLVVANWVEISVLFRTQRFVFFMAVSALISVLLFRWLWFWIVVATRSYRQCVTKIEYVYQSSMYPRNNNKHSYNSVCQLEQHSITIAYSIRLCGILTASKSIEMYLICIVMNDDVLDDKRVHVVPASRFQSY